MRAALGREAVGPKTESGDRRTPEGVYHVAGDPHEGRFHRFIPIDYPSVADAARALKGARISEADAARIVDAHARGELPPQDTPLGGDLGLHGEGEEWRGHSAHVDWTYGCIAVRDEEIDFLAERVAPGVPVEIHP